MGKKVKKKKYSVEEENAALAQMATEPTAKLSDALKAIMEAEGPELDFEAILKQATNISDEDKKMLKEALKRADKIVRPTGEGIGKSESIARKNARTNLKVNTEPTKYKTDEKGNFIKKEEKERE